MPKRKRRSSNNPGSAEKKSSPDEVNFVLIESVEPLSSTVELDSVELPLNTNDVESAIQEKHTSEMETQRISISNEDDLLSQTETEPQQDVSSVELLTVTLTSNVNDICTQPIASSQELPSQDKIATASEGDGEEQPTNIQAFQASVEDVMHDHNLAKSISTVQIPITKDVNSSDGDDATLRFDNTQFSLQFISTEQPTPSFILPHGYQLVSLPPALPNLIASSVLKTKTIPPLPPPRSEDIERERKKSDDCSECSEKEVFIIDDEEGEECHVGKSSFLKKNATVTVQTDDGELTMQRFFYQKGLCRICLLEKEDTVDIFEDVLINEKGCVANSKGPKSVHYNILPAIKTLLDIDVEFGDGLPDQICGECLDNIVRFSSFRKQIAISQSKLNDVIHQVIASNTPTFLPPLGETDFRNTDIFRHPESIIEANHLMKTSKFSHLVRRNLSDRVMDKFFASMALVIGVKSEKLKQLEIYAHSAPYCEGWFCQECSITIHGCKLNFAQHQQVVHGLAPTVAIMLPCDICGGSFPLEDNGIRDTYAQHWIQHFFLLNCHLCSKKFPSYNSLRNHKRSAHGRLPEKIHICPTCGKKFGRKGHLESHVKTHLDPSEKELFMCDKCGKGLSDATNLANHLNFVHSNERKWSCDLCPKVYKRKEILIQHRNRVHSIIPVPKNFACDRCGDLFETDYTLKQHMKHHTNERNYHCVVCDAKFFTSSALKSHAIRHKNTGELRCTEPGCEKIFKRKINLKEHMLIHTNEMPHTCPICGKQIRMKCNLFKHLKVHKRQKEQEEKANAGVVLEYVQQSL